MTILVVDNNIVQTKKREQKKIKFKQHIFDPLEEHYIEVKNLFD